MKKGIFKKGLAFLACFALVLTTMVSSLSMMVNAEGPKTVKISLSVADGTTPPEHYGVDFKLVKADDKSVINDQQYHIENSNSSTQALNPGELATTNVELFIKVTTAGKRLNLGGSEADSEYSSGIYIPYNEIQSLYNFELFESSRPGGAGGSGGAGQVEPTNPKEISVSVDAPRDVVGAITIDGYTVVDGKVTVERDVTKRTIAICEGGLGNPIGSISINGKAITPIPEQDKGWTTFTDIEDADSYSIVATAGESNIVTMLWVYDQATADERHFGTDSVVENGKVELVSIKRGGDFIYNGEPDVEDVSIDDKGGYVRLEKGDDVVVRLIPNYGYQLKSVSVNGMDMKAQKEVSTFELRNIQGNLHFAGAFVKAEDKTFVDSDLVSKASIANGANAANSGNLLLTVWDESNYDKDLTPVIGDSEVVSSLDLLLANVVSKGDSTYWSNGITEFTNPIKLSLTLDQELAAGEKITVVRDHNGTLTELPATYVNGVLSFESNQFSTYTVVKTKAETVAFADMDSNVKVSAGKGTIAKITDAKVQQACETRSAEVDVLASQIETKSKVAEVVKTFAFDVQGIASGEVTLNIGTENAGKLVLASHFGGEAWDNLGLCEVNEKGDVTVKSDSYSPIMLSVLNIKADDLTDEAKADVKTVNYDPQQSVKAPKTGDNSNLLVYVVVMVIALALTAGLVVIKKRRNI